MAQDNRHQTLLDTGDLNSIQVIGYPWQHTSFSAWHRWPKFDPGRSLMSHGFNTLLSLLGPGDLNSIQVIGYPWQHTSFSAWSKWPKFGPCHWLYLTTHFFHCLAPVTWIRFRSLGTLDNTLLSLLDTGDLNSIQVDHWCPMATHFFLCLAPVTWIRSRSLVTRDNTLLSLLGPGDLNSVQVTGYPWQHTSFSAWPQWSEFDPGHWLPVTTHFFLCLTAVT